jgi:hypothetical protein
LLGAGAVNAAENARAPLDVAFQDCDSEPIGEPAFFQALGLELDQELEVHSPRSGAEGPTPNIDVKFRCDGLALIRIQLETSSTQRRVRFSDVAKAERARALALVVAELYRSGSQSPSPADSNDRAFPDPAEAAPAAKAPDAAAAVENASPPSAPPKRAATNGNDATPSAPSDAGVAGRAPKRPSTRPRIRAAATLRTSIAEEGTHYGGGLGVDFHFLRLGAETLFSRETRARGAISTGIAAVRVARGVSLLHAGAFELQGALSAAIGATWAVGDSSVVGSVVRDVLLPYGDARLGLLLLVHAESDLEPELELYAGRAAGILARADGETTQETGGWFAGVEAGLSF